MDNHQILKRLLLIKKNPKLAEILPQGEILQYIETLVTAFEALKNAIETNKIKGEDGYTPVEGKDYYSKQQVKDFLENSLNKYETNVSFLIKKVEERLETITNGKDGDDAEITEEIKKEIAEMCYGLISLPDFDALIDERLTANPFASRDSLELISKEEDKLEQSAIKNLVQDLDNLRKDIYARVNTQGGTIGKNQVYNFIQQAIADGTIGAGSLPTGGTTGQVLTKQSNADGDADWQDPASGSGIVETIVAGTGISIDSTDPANPIVSATGGGGVIAPVTARIYRNTNQSIPTGATFTDISWTTAAYEVNGNFWTSGATVTIPEDGYYQIFTEATFDGTGLLSIEEAEMDVLLNGTTVIAADATEIGINSLHSLKCITQRLFTAGDTLKSQVKHSGATAINIISQGDHSPDIILTKLTGAKGDQGDPGTGDMLAATYDPANKAEQVLTIGDKTTTATASKVVERDANGNIFVNNYFGNLTSTVSAGGTTVLTAASSKTQRLTGSSTQTFQLPVATTLPLSSIFEFDNNSSSSLIITNNAGTTQYTVPAGGAVIAQCVNNGSSNGVWDFHALTPASVTWSSGITGLVMNSALSTTPSILSGASSSTTPSFIPQRGANTTGFGGDGTKLFATIAGTAAQTVESTGTTAPKFTATTDNAYDATTWNGSLRLPTENAVRDKIDAMDTAIALNTAKVTNATHTGDVTGATALTASPTMISGKTASSGLTGTEEVLINEAGTLKKTTTQDIANLGGAGSFVPSRSARMGWVFPDNTINAATDIAAEKWHTLSAMWYELESDGDFLKRDSSSFGSNFFYTAANALLVRENATVALVNLSSGNATAVNALTTSSTKRANLIAEMISFCRTNNFDGVDLDLETFQVASMSAGQYTDFKTMLQELGDALHAEGYILSIEVPPIWNTAANTESGSGDAWDSANSQGYYRLVYSDLNSLPVDKMVVMAYDYQFDYSAGEPNQPLKWLEEIMRFTRQNIDETRIEIIAGIPSAGYSGATGGYSITGRTYDYLSVQTGFSGASRDAASGELIWANGGISYAAIDDTAIQLKVAQAEAVGIYKYALWHVGNNQYGGDALTYVHPDVSRSSKPTATASFTTIAVSGQSNVVADSTADTLTLVAGTNVTITTNATTDTVTISASGGGGSGLTRGLVLAQTIYPTI